MCNLSLSIAAKNVKVLNLRKPEGFLFRVAEILHRDSEHAHCETNSRKETLKVSGPIGVGWLKRRFFEENLRMFFVHDIDALPELLLHLMGCHIVKLNGITHSGILLKKAKYFSRRIYPLLASHKEGTKLLRIEVLLSPLIEKVWRNNASFDAACLC